MRTRELVPLAICFGIFVAGNVIAAEALAHPAASTDAATAERPASTVSWRKAAVQSPEDVAVAA